MKSHKQILIILVALCFVLAFLPGLIFKGQYGCGFEGCMSKGGWPFSIYQPNGIGGSEFSFIGIGLNYSTLFATSLFIWWVKVKLKSKGK